MFRHNNDNEYDETDDIQFKGLRNQGATSYLNVIFQCLFFTPELREGIYNLSEQELGIQHLVEADKLDQKIKNNKYKLKDEDIAKLTSLGYTQLKAKRALVKAENNYETAANLLKTNNVPSVKRILIELRHFFSLLSAGKESSISTKSIIDAFGYNVQHDVHELNRILIDAIQRSLKGTKSENLIKSIYEGQMVSRTLCLECEYYSERRENFLDAIVQVKHHPNLQESLSMQCQSIYLVDDNKYFCDGCNQKCVAKRSVAYTKLPNVLTLALNRFVFNLYTLNREKCNDQFEFPLILDFEPFSDEKLSNQQRKRTVEDEEILKEVFEEYLKEQKDKEAAKQKRLKQEQRRRQQHARNNDMNETQKIVNGGNNSYNIYNDGLCEKIDIIVHPEPDGMDIMRRYGTEWNRYYNSSTQNISATYYDKNLKVCDPKINLNSNHLYALTGVVIHRGTPHAGHYHIYLKDYLNEGKYQKITKRGNSDKEEKEEKKEETDDVERGTFISTVCDALWYDFNDSSIYHIPQNKVAKQYGGQDECGYMLIYRKINKKLGKELMNEPNLKLPPDLVEYVKKHNAKIEEEKKQKEAKANEIKIRIIHPHCFNIKDNKLTMNAFIESLLKKIIRLSREKIKIDKIIDKNNNKKNDGEFEKNEEERKKEEELEQEEIEKLYLEKSWPTNLSSMDIYKIVQEHFKQKSIFITCDGRQNVDKLIPLIYKKLQQENIENTQLNEENIQLHFLSIPSAFQDDKIECKSIANLLNGNIGANVEDRIFPIKSKRLKRLFNKERKKNDKDEEDKEKEEDDDEYRYERMPEKIGELPFKKLDFIMNTRACFVWNGKDINGTKFDLSQHRTQT